MASEIPAFLCERVNLDCDVRRVADMTVVEDLSRQRRNMLYVSRGQLKKHSNTALNVSVSAHYISQQVSKSEIEPIVCFFLYFTSQFLF